jgi:hypothetical protein
MSMARERIEYYTSPFFSRPEHATLFFYQLEERRAWIVGSVALAALSFSCDLAVPDNLNVISSVLTEEAWVTCMCGHLGFTLLSSGPCRGFYAKLAKKILVFSHNASEVRVHFCDHHLTYLGRTRSTGLLRLRSRAVSKSSNYSSALVLP